jgi:polyisoprenoid-binding protein YceI
MGPSRPARRPEGQEDAMSQTAQAERVYQGISIPPTGEYTIDPSHTTVEFVARHMLTKVRGRFTDFDGSIIVADTPEDSSARVTVRTSSVTTDDEQRDAHLLTSDFFEVDAFPELRFTSTAFRPTGGNGFELDGELTVKGVTKPITLKGEFLGWGGDLWGNDRLFAEARTRVNREEWNLLWNAAVELTGVLVAKEVGLEFQVQAFKQPSG